MSEHTRRFGDLLVELGLVTEGQVAEALALQPLTGTRVGEALLSLGYLTRAQLQRALSIAVTRGEHVVLDRPPLGEILIGLRAATPEQVQEGLETQRTNGRRLGEVLVDKGVVDHRQLYEALGLQQRMANVTEAKSKSAATSPSARRLVVVDDSELACNLVQEGLSTQGFEVVAFTDPYLALEQIDLLEPDLVLTDLDMPGIDGAELCQRLKNGPRGEVPVIMLTAQDEDGQRVAGLRAGADDYISKGASMDELAARVHSVLRRTSETKRVRRLFARYTSDAVVDEILRTGDVVLTGERREVTVLFADLRNFTALAEDRPPEDVMRVLNELLGRLADAVLEWGGTLDKFLGDGLMAIWGAPVRRDDDAESAVSAALQMQQVVRERNASYPAEQALELGIGINSGVVIAGSVGNARRTEYTCIGDTVNVASRLCALAAGGEILVGEATAGHLVHLSPLEPLPPARVKGKARPVPLFRVTPTLEAALNGQRRF
ncbi:MAG: adenylate/guanylate cyclase domain-containing protein [Myxococcota bacterium]